MFSGLKISIRPLAGLLTLLLLLSGSCSYYRRNTHDVQQAIYNSDVPRAYKVISSHEEKWLKGRNDLLYYWDRGTLAWMMGKYDESIDYFKRSDYFLEDIYKNYANIGLSLFVNDRVKDYIGEDHERILFHYYQIVNFLKVNNIEHALVQSRRLKLELERLDDRYKDRKDKTRRRYQRDPFAYVLIGLVNEAAGETNNAYIAYKLAYQVYSEDYLPFFGMDAPRQLKEDLLRTAAVMGFQADLEYYEKQFGFKYDPKIHQAGNFVFFWNNGLAPVKEEVSVNFTILKGLTPGWIIFFNNDLGISIPVYVGEDKTKDGSAFSKVEFVRAAFPKYFSRGAYYKQADLVVNGESHPLQLLENVDAVSFKVMEDHFLEELGKTLLRVALKKAAEYEIRKQDETAGALVGIANAITEQADTRCWVTLPSQISYTRMKLPAATYTMELYVKNGLSSEKNSFDFSVSGSKMYFHAFHTLRPGKVRY